MFGNNMLALAGLVSLAVAGVVPAPQHPPMVRRANETVVTTTKVVEQYTTYCPEPTTFELGGHTYEVTEPTTLTITECPCTVTEPCHTCAPAPTGTGVPPGPPTPPGPPGPPASPTPPGPPSPPDTTPPPEQSPVPPVSGAAGGSQNHAMAVLAGAAVVGMLAL